MLDNVAIPAVRQNRSKLAPTSCQASSTIAPVPMAADVLIFFMALLSFVGFDTPSLTGSRRATPTSQFQQQPGHPQALSLIWTALVGLFRSPASLAAEILVLRHQINILRRHSPKRQTFSAMDRLIFAGLYRF